MSITPEFSLEKLFCPCYSLHMNRHTFTRVLAGFGIITIGVLALLGSLDVINFGEIASTWWPLVVIGVGLLMFLSNFREFVWPTLIIFAGILFQLREFDLVTFNIWQLFWPIVLIIIGISVLVNRTNANRHASSKDTDEITAIFGGNDTKNLSSDYKGGRATAIFGGVALDLREAKITDEATLEVFALCGGIDIKVPEGWVVKTKVTPILGGVDNKAKSSSDKKAPTLLVVGDVIMGGVDIKH